MSDANPAKKGNDEPVAEKRAPEPVVAKRKVEPQAEMHFHEHGIKQIQCDAIAKLGVEPADVLEPEYWSHVTQRSLQPWAKISIWREDRAWYGELLVWAVHSAGTGATVSWIAGPFYRDSARIKNEESDFDVFDQGDIKGGSVRFRKDGRVFIDGCKSRQEADAALRNWLRSQGGRRAA